MANSENYFNSERSPLRGSRRAGVGQNILPQALLFCSFAFLFISQVALGVPPVEYWDNPSPSGSWHTNFWSFFPAGGAPILGWNDFNSAVFSATNAGATGNFTVTLDSSVVVRNLTYTGGDVGSTLQIATNSGVNTITMAASPMQVTVDALTTLIVAPAIVGAGGSLILQGGTLVLTGANTYDGGTTIAGGTLQLGSVGAQGSIVGAVVNNDTFSIVNADTAGITTITNNLGTTNFVNGSTAGNIVIANNNGFTAFFNTSNAGTAAITNNGGTTEFFDTSSGDHANIITNDGGFTEFFDTSTAGNAGITVNSGGETEFQNASNAGNSTITNNGGVINFNDMATASAAIINNDTGSTNFNNTSTAGHATIANDNGITNFNNTSTAGHAAITDNSGGVTNFNNATTAGNAAIINQNGFVNPGLGGVNPASPSINTAGIANFNNLSTAGSATIMNIGGVTNFNDTSTAGGATITNEGGVTNSTIGTAAAAISFIGTTNFNNGSTAGNAFIVNNGHGATEFFATSTAGNSSITTNSGGETLFFATSTGGQARLITNAGGTVDISGLSSDGMIAGSIEGAGTYLLGSKSLTVGSNSLSTMVSGVIQNGGLASGAGGALIKVGTGTLTLTGLNSYSGGTSFNGGIIAVNKDANLGTGALSFNGGGLEALASGGGVTTSKAIRLNAGGGTFLADPGTTSTFSAAISGAGSLTKDGSGALVLAGTNLYEGGTILNAGVLTVNGAQALGLGNVAVYGGILRADPQPISVRGNYTQGSGGTLQLQVAGANPGQYDTLNVSGNAALGGTLQLISLGFQPNAGDQLTLVASGGTVSGQFAHFVDPFTVRTGLNTIDLIYGKQSVVLEFLNQTTPVLPVIPTVPTSPSVVPPTVIETINFASFALTANELAAANLLDAVQLYPGAAALISFLDKEPFANLSGDLNKISPDGLTAFYEISFSNANIQRLNLESRLDDLHNGSSGFSSNMKVNGAMVNLEDRADADGKSSKAVVEPILQPGPGNRWGVWMTGFGDFVSVDSGDNANGYDFTTGGVSLGVDYRITDQLAIGAMAGYSHTWTSLQPSGNIDVNSGRGGFYATWYRQGIYLNGAIYGGYNNYDSSRSGLRGLATGSTGGAEMSTFISGGYDFHFASLTVGPIAALQYTYSSVSGFSENGSLAPMQIQSDSANSLRSDVGFRIFCQRQIGKILVEPSLKAAWEHEYLYSALPVTASFAGISSPTATFFGPSEGHDSAIISAGVSAQLTPVMNIYVNYDGQLARGNYDSNAVTGGVRIGF